MPCFNAADTIVRTFGSVFDQTLTDYELLVVDDGSSDETPKVILDSARQNMPVQARLQVLSQENRGPGAARNLGMSQGRGDLIAFLDADDVWSPEYLATVAGVFERFPQVDALASNAWDVYPDGCHLALEPRNDTAFIIEDYFKARLDRTIVVRTSGVTMRRSVASRVGYMREDLLRSQDTEYWARLAASGICWGFSPEPLVFYDRVGARSLSRGLGWYINVPSPEMWSRDIWPLLDSSMHESFRKVYLRRAKGYCREYIRAGLDNEARTTAKEALSRATGCGNTLFFLAVRFGPSNLYRLVWRGGSWVKGLLRDTRRTLRARRARTTSPDRS